MKLTCCHVLAFSTVFCVTGCVVGDNSGEEVGAADQAALAGNALAGNALAGNALAGNALAGNALAGNALAGNALAAIQDPSQTGTLARQLLEYTAGCALTPSQSVSFSWTDSLGVVHQESYGGLLGLAPEWATGPLTSTSDQELVSACLAARTNYFGVVVHISVRGTTGALLNNTSDAEYAAYPYVEGAFWGNLFTPTPYVASCYNATNAAHSDADQRVCATGYLDAGGQLLPCGSITLTGPCDQHCSTLNVPHELYPSCDGHSNVITVGLQ